MQLGLGKWIPLDSDNGSSTSRCMRYSLAKVVSGQAWPTAGALPRRRSGLAAEDRFLPESHRLSPDQK